MIKKVIYIGGVARSGTSWIGQIFNSSDLVRYRFQPLFSYEFKGVINEDSSKENFQRFFNDLFNTESDFLIQRDKIESGIYPRFDKDEEKFLCFKENRYQSIIEPMLRKNDNVYFVGLIRNPCATLYSWTKNEKEFPKGSDIIREWRFGNCKNNGNEDYFGYYKWKEVANLYIDLEIKYPNRVSIVQYENFVDDPINETKKIFDQIGVPFEDQTMGFLKKSQTGNDESYYSVFKGKTNKKEWKQKFPQKIQKEIREDLRNTRLEKYLYD